jgi:imidazolonepropionase
MGGMVYPGYVDSHTHLVFAQSREEEFQDRINGMTYEEIATNGGGILNSVRKLAAMPEEQLFEEAKQRLSKLIRLGTTTIEIKSGYGLSLEAELKILRVAKQLKDWSPIPIKSTFLGAHAIPLVYKDRREDYISLIIEEMLPVIAKEGLADFIDVFCEKGYFTVDEMAEIIEAGKKYGLVPKVHVNQFNSIGGIQKAVEHHALSVDHLEVMNQEDIETLQDSNTFPVLLPSCSFFLGIPYGPARRLMDHNLPLVLASDYNPGSTPSGNMNFVFSLACIQLKMNPEEALNSMTINAAAALDLSDEVGSITIGKKANFILTTAIKNLAYIPYSFGENCIEQVFVNGVPFIPNN